MAAIMKTQIAESAGAAAPRLAGGATRPAGDPAPARGVALAWEEFAPAWSLAEDRLARLEQQLSSSDLRHCWICRTDIEEVAAMLALQGQQVALEDLVLADAGEQPRKPSPAWQTAHALLAARRYISRAGPAKILCCDGVLALHGLLAPAGGDSRLGDFDSAVRRAEKQRVERWLIAVEGLQSTPPLAAAAIALRTWRDIAPLHTHNSEIGLLLTATLLWHWGKTKGLSACLATGLLAVGCRLHERTLLGTWMRQFCEAVQVAADGGRETHERLRQGHRRMAALLSRHRRNSRLPRLAWLFLSYPVLSVGFISRRLDLTAPGSVWLLQELVREKVVEEATGKARNRVYRLS